jgi:hypothetical protein
MRVKDLPAGGGISKPAMKPAEPNTPATTVTTPSGATAQELTAQYQRTEQHSTIPEPHLSAGFHAYAEVPTTKTRKRGDWLEGVSAHGIDAKVDSKQAKALLDQAVADYHRDVTGGSMRTLTKEELFGLASMLTGKYSPLLDVLKADFGDRTIYPNRPAVLLGKDPDGPTVWLMGWRKGDATDIHSHNETLGSVSVHRGKVREKTWDPESGTLQHNREFVRGQGAAIPAPYIHQVANEQDELATTIHAYHPPLYMMELYRLEDGKAVMTGRWEDDERVEWEARQKAKGAE